MRRGFFAVAVLAAALFQGPAQAAVSTGNVYGGPETVVALLDTGVRPTHQEFDYQGPTSTTDQFVGWWDFTNTLAPFHTPAPGQTWDPIVPTPYDDHGHGTATASLAVGRNIAPAAKKEPSFAPGFPFAEGKVCLANASCSQGLTAAGIRWAVDEVHADVVSISIGAVAPLPDAMTSVTEATEYARKAGVLVVVSAGNGIADTGLVPNPVGWATANGGSPAVLAVGASETVWQELNTYDPEVTAPYNLVPVASSGCDTCYRSNWSGTSFSAPYVAGLAALAEQTAIANGRDVTPDGIEQLLKYCARDTVAPPTIEGYGALDAAQASCVTTNAAAGTLPSRPDPDVNAEYVDGVGGTLRSTWADQLDGGIRSFSPLHIAPGNGPGKIGLGLDSGQGEGEAYSITLPPRAGLKVTLHYLNPMYTGIIDLYVFRSEGPTFLSSDLVGVAPPQTVVGTDMSVSFRSLEGGIYSVLALARTGFGPPATPTPFLMITVTDAPGSPQLSFIAEDTYASDSSSFAQ